MKRDSYWARSKTFMTTTDWAMLAICAYAVIASIWTASVGLAIFFGLAGLLLWWGNVSPHYPKGDGPDD